MNRWLSRLFSGKSAVTGVNLATSVAKPYVMFDSVAHRRRGNEFLDQGDLHSAIDSYRKAVAADPNSVDAQTSLGYALKESGNPEAARRAFEKACELQPDAFDPAYLLGQTCTVLRQHQTAAECFEKALAIQPAFEPLYGELCLALFQSNSLRRAGEVIREGVKRYPANASFHFYLGNLCSFAQEWQLAIASYASALSLNPKMVQAHANLAAVFRAQGQMDAAQRQAELAMQADPDSPDARACIAANQEAAGRLEEALASYELALGIDARHAGAQRGKGKVLFRLGRLDAAIQSYDKALTIEPDSAETYRDLGLVYLELHKYQDAEKSSRKALALRPQYPSAQNNLGMALSSLGRVSEAEQCYRAALSLEPDSDAYLSNLGGILMAQGRMAEAVESFRRATDTKVKATTAQPHLLHSNLLFCLSHSERVDPGTLFSEHRRFAEIFEAPLRNEWPLHANPRVSDRALQLGILSGDFYSHVVPQFVGPVLAHLSRDPALSLHAYHNNVIQDETTELLKGYFKYWHPVAGLSDVAVAQQIGQDGIDILIDLSGHTGLNRLLVFARKPAPLQLSWLGYPGTTGLQAMDYYLADTFVLPVGRFDDQFSEKIVHLPALAPFQPSDVAPPVNGLPAVVNGFVTFGSFNRASKINRTVVAWWAELLRALPSARLLIEGVPEDGDCMQWLALEGIQRERLSWHGRDGMVAYHALHHQVDICLDAFPYNGATTTWCAAWMGVPTLALAGSTPAGRYGAAIMGQMGLKDFVANDLQDFVCKGVYWSQHVSDLAVLRSTMRARFGHSTVGQPDLIAAALANACRVMWRRWCSGLPAESFVAPTVLHEPGDFVIQ